MRRLFVAALLGAVTTFVAALALRAPDATTAVVAVAALVVLVAFVGTQHSTDEESGLALTNPASTLALTVVGRSPGVVVLPLVVAQLVGAVLAGLAVLGLGDDRLGPTLTWSTPHLLATGIATFVLGVLGTWVVLAVDGGLAVPFAGIAPLLSGAALPLSLGAGLNPAVVVGLATANVLPWDVATVAGVVGLVAGAAGAYSVGVISATE